MLIIRPGIFRSGAAHCDNTHTLKRFFSTSPDKLFFDALAHMLQKLSTQANPSNEQAVGRRRRRRRRKISNSELVNVAVRLSPERAYNHTVTVTWLSRSSK